MSDEDYLASADPQREDGPVPTWPDTEAERTDFRDWQYEVANGDTLLGYRPWVAAKHDKPELVLEPAPRHYVLLTDSDNDSLLISCESAERAVEVAGAAVWSDGGVSAWLWPEDVVHLSDEHIQDLREGAQIANLDRTHARPITITEGPANG